MSVAVGVGQACCRALRGDLVLESSAFEEPDEEDALAQVRGSHVESPYRNGDRSRITGSPKLLHNFSKPPPCAGGDVLDDDGGRLQLPDEPEHVEPREAAAAFSTIEPSSFARARDVGAHEPAAENVHFAEILLGALHHVAMQLHVREMVTQHALTERVLLDHPSNPVRDPGLLQGRPKPKIQPGNTREQRTNCDHSSHVAFRYS